MKLDSFAGAVIAAVCISSAAAAGSLPDQIVDEFLKALPPVATARPDVDPAELSRLGTLNPGHEAEITPILATYGRCLRPAVDEATARMMRSMAVGLGQEKITKLTEFYRGPDYQTYLKLLGKTDANGNLAGADAVTATRLLRAYPIMELEQALRGAQDAASEDKVFVEAATECSLAKRDAFIRAGIKYRP